MGAQEEVTPRKIRHFVIIARVATSPEREGPGLISPANCCALAKAQVEHQVYTRRMSSIRCRSASPPVT